VSRASDGRSKALPCAASGRVHNRGHPGFAYIYVDRAYATVRPCPTAGRRRLVDNPFRRGLRCDAEPEDLSPALAHDQQPNYFICLHCDSAEVVYVLQQSRRIATKDGMSGAVMVQSAPKW
jgi:hypothetical protein